MGHFVVEAGHSGIEVTPTHFRKCEIVARHAVARVGLPAIVKPISETGSTGVTLVETETVAIQALRNLLGATADVRGRRIHPGALLMSYIAGDEFSVEIFDSRVFGVRRKHLGALPHFVEIGHDAPAIMSPQLRPQMVDEALRATEVPGHRRGPAHVELRAHQGCVTIIEVNPRPAGGSIPSVFLHATGFDPVLAVLRSLLGMPPEAPTAGAYGSIRFIVPEHEGHFQIHQNCERLVGRSAHRIRFISALPTEFRRYNDFRD
ncbi:ATP-grasp domain-containing protein [Bradyrhizobium sp. C-145]|uniref:ATP-grasp domain-containing protein n=1 Tax=Bradyrhizobium sp. C-145 TaxID=574727 RepID=UPI00201B970D|nr:ATP-grasp domain-containing protein [Bradyrhizobium sp. C-145]UQR61471.1 ATP-grasp domain-containing protein [Bradyrhizobium sp. C-145]